MVPHHRLFGELLRGRLRHHDPSEAAACHRRASAWYAETANRSTRSGTPSPEGTSRSPRTPWPRPGSVCSSPANAPFSVKCWPDCGRPRRPPRRPVGRRGLRVLRRPSAEASARALGSGDDARRRAVGPRALCAARYDGDLVTADAVDGEAPAALVQLCRGVSALWSFAFERAQQHLSQAVIAARVSGFAYLQLDALAHLALARTLHHGPATANELAAQATAIPPQPHWARTPAIAAMAAAQAHIAAHEARPRAATLYWTQACDAGPEPHLELALNRLRALLDGTPEPARLRPPAVRSAIMEGGSSRH